MSDLICPSEEEINLDDGMDGMLSQAVDIYCSDCKILVFLISSDLDV